LSSTHVPKLEGVNTVPAWAASAIWYSVYPLGACGAPIREAEDGVHHRLGRLEAWLDHVIALGANGLALGPVWRSSTHGYDIIDHDAIDPRLGDEADFEHLIESCHARGLRVLLDGVFNHVSSQHADVARAQAEGAESESGRLFLHDPNQPDGLSRFEGHAGLVEYDHSNPAVAARVASTMTRWLGRGADGWRLDAAYRIPAEFWASVLAQTRSQFPDSLTVAEVLHGDYAAFAGRSGVDSVTQYELWKAIWSSLHDHNPHELWWALQRHSTGLSARPGEFLPWTFVGNHDVTRIATQVGFGDALVAAAILMTLPGMPAVYYGDEFGFTGLKQECVGGDDAIRPPLPDDPAELLAAPSAAAAFRQYQLLVGLRRRHDLTWGRLDVLSQRSRSLVYLVTPPAGDHLAVKVTLEALGDHHKLTISDETGVLFAL